MYDITDITVNDDVVEMTDMRDNETTASVFIVKKTEDLIDDTYITTIECVRYMIEGVIEFIKNNPLKGTSDDDYRGWYSVERWNIS